MGLLYLYRPTIIAKVIHVSNVRSESKKSAGGVSKISVITLSDERKDRQQRQTAVS